MSPLHHKSGGGVTSQYIITQVETLRPVFQAVAEGYEEYYDPDWKSDLVNEGDRYVIRFRRKITEEF